MTPRLTRLLILAAVMISSACDAPSPAHEYEPAPRPAGVSLPSTATKPSQVYVDVDIAVSDLRQVDWDQATIPPGFCGLSGLTPLVDGSATSTSATWGPVHIAAADVTYGDLLEDEDEEAAVAVYCDNGGGTASSVLESGIVLFAERDGRLMAVGTVTARKQFPGQMPTLLSMKEWHKPLIVVSESYYRVSDSTCCPSGKAETDWTWTGQSLSSGATRILE